MHHQGGEKRCSFTSASIADSYLAGHLLSIFSSFRCINDVMLAKSLQTLFDGIIVGKFTLEK